MSEIESSYKCIKILKKAGNYFQRWEQIKNVYKPQMNIDLFGKDAQYTPHDYSNHCRNIYRIFDIIIPAESYRKSLTIENFFILNIAVIMHDIAMITKPQSRNNHSEEAKKFILQQVLSSKDSFLKELLTPEEAVFIADVVFGHSDVKKSDGSILIETIPELPNSDFREGRMGAINTQMLAAILRLADEFDITSWRVTGKNLVRGKISKESETHWRKCDLFGYPSTPSDDKTTIYLRPNSHKIEADGNLDNDIILMLEVENKISAELTKLNNLVFKTGCLSGWTISKVEIFTNNTDITQRIEKKRKKQTSPLESQLVDLHEKTAVNSLDTLVNIRSNITSIELVSEEESKRIENWVIENSMLRDGHYYIDKDRHARDWIETHGLLSNSNYIDQISYAFAKYLALSIKNASQHIHIIGEGFPGILLASLLAFKNGYSFTYHIPHQYNDHHSKPEKEIIIKKDANIVLVTDVIVTGKTIENTIDSLIANYDLLEENISKILTIFFREPLDQKSEIAPRILNKIVCLNDTFPIEICRKSKCLFTKFNLIEPQYKPTN